MPTPQCRIPHQRHPWLKGRPWLVLVAAVISGALASSLRATDYTWIGDTTSSNDWGTGSNWLGGVVPAASGSNRIQVGVSGHAIDFAHRVILSTSVTSSGGTSSRALVIANGANGYMEITTGGSFISTSTSPDIIGNGGGNGTLLISGGTYQKITGTGDQSTFDLLYGQGTGNLWITSGSFQVTTLDFQGTSAGNNSNQAIVQLDGGLLSAGSFAVSNAITGATYTINLNGGTLQARQDNATWASSKITWSVQSNSTIDTQTYAVGVASVLSGSGGLTKKIGRAHV